MICFFFLKQLTGIFAWSSYSFSWTTLGQMSTSQLSQVHFRRTKSMEEPEARKLGSNRPSLQSGTHCSWGNCNGSAEEQICL